MQTSKDSLKDCFENVNILFVIKVTKVHRLKREQMSIVENKRVRAGHLYIPKQFIRKTEYCHQKETRKTREYIQSYQTLSLNGDSCQRLFCYTPLSTGKLHTLHK